ncbi:glutathione S-transferase family protein [Acetobacter senegalensis]|uniref:glutathione S-transferase family protein n=1 Tax=Acetobacter senegalensis TaxID=446692 RepID=UPI00264C274C|nr:glutathione S-transferase family protein [Acetobacter senegalensis]MDN7349978.1 glutathione S-transferase family protein [Acetobacter senegalensis]
MGYLLHGKWYAAQGARHASDENGTFSRQPSQFRNWITPDGKAGPTGEGGFRAETGRYHLYVSLACPWAHRTLIFRQLKGVADHISLSVTHWLMGEQGWTFEAGPGVQPDMLHSAHFLYELYVRADSAYSGNVTVPVLWDTYRDTIVSNESADIIRMMNSAFDEVGAREGDYYPVLLRGEIDAVNERIYRTLNNGVYKCGFAQSQQAYERALHDLFETLDWLEHHLRGRRWLVGEQLTEADWRLFTTLIRFDAVYVGHFKCNVRRLCDYPVLSRYMERLYALPGIAETVSFFHIKHHYYLSHPWLDPIGIVPVGPQPPFGAARMAVSLSGEGIETP